MAVIATLRCSNTSFFVDGCETGVFGQLLVELLELVK